MIDTFRKRKLHFHPSLPDRDRVEMEYAKSWTDCKGMDCFRYESLSNRPQTE